MSELVYRGNRVFYVSEGSGQTIVFIHGLGGNTNNWLYQRMEFKKTFHVLTLDLPGHGRSKEARSVPFNEYSAIIKQLMDQLGLPDVIVCGISMGGKVALQFAKDYPDAARGLVLANTFACLDEEARENQKHLYRLIKQPDGVDNWMKNMIGQMGLDPHSRLAKAFDAGIKENDLEFIYELAMELQEIDQCGDLKSIHSPALILHGVRDQFVPLRYAIGLQEGLPNATLKVIENSGHLPNVEQPRAFNDALKHFLAAL